LAVLSVVSISKLEILDGQLIDREIGDSGPEASPEILGRAPSVFRLALVGAEASRIEVVTVEGSDSSA
jgi:hypothetical protein